LDVMNNTNSVETSPSYQSMESKSSRGTWRVRTTVTKQKRQCVSMEYQVYVPLVIHRVREFGLQRSIICFTLDTLNRDTGNLPPVYDDLVAKC